MKKHSKKYRFPPKGLSLLEVVIGMAIMVFVILSGLIASNTLAKAAVSISLATKADQKLQSKADEIRRLAVGEFGTMTEVMEDRTCPPGFDLNKESTYHLCPDHKIDIRSTITPIDPFKKTRNVSLIASWKEGGHQKSKTLSFILSPVRGKIRGGYLKVTTKEEITDYPLPGVKVFADGEDSARVSCQTEEDGSCLLEGVLLGDVRITYDGEDVFHYFLTDANIAGLNNPNAPNGGQWTKEYLMTISSGSEVVNLPVVRLFPPGSIEGEIVDPANSSNKVDGVTVALRVKDQNTLVFPNFTNRTDDSETDPLSHQVGKFSFRNVMPGQYTLHLIGNNRYAATAQVDDYLAINRTKYAATVVSGGVQTFFEINGDPTKKSLKTTQRGSIRFKVRTIGYSLTNPANLASPYMFTLGTIAPTPARPARFDFVAKRDITTSGGVNYPFQNTVPFVEFDAIRLRPERWSVADEGNGISIENIAPNIFNSDLNITAQYGKTEMIPASIHYLPFTPVIVLPDPPNDPVNGFNTPKLKYLDTLGLQYFHPNGTAGDTFEIPLHGNEEFNRDFYLLDANSYGNVTGRLQWLDKHGNEISAPSPGGFTRSFVFPNGPALAIGAGQETSFPAESLRVPLNPAEQFSFIDVAGRNRLAPNFGGDTTIIRYFGEEDAEEKTKDFEIVFKGYEKIDDGSGNILGQEIMNFNSYPHNIKISISNGAVDVPVSIVVNVGIAADQKVIQSQVYAGESVPVKVLPGVSQQFDIKVNPAAETWKLYSISDAGSVDDWLVKWKYRSFPGQQEGVGCSYQGGKYRIFGPPGVVEMYRKGKTGALTGRVMDTGTPAARISGAAIHIKRGGYTTEYLDPVTGQLPVTGLDGRFTILNVPFVMAPEFNGQKSYELTVHVSNLGFESTKIALEAFNGMDYDYGDINLQQPTAQPPLGGF